MLVWDTGASIGLTPFRSDFIDYLPLDGVTVKDIARTNSVLGIGTIMWKLPTTKGHPVFIPAVAYHMPDCDIRLFSPQSYFNLHGGDATVTARSVVMRLPDKHEVHIPIDPTVNLPTIPHPQPTLEEQDEYGPHLLSSIVANTLHLSGLAKPVCCKTVADVTNNNLSGPQRELIQWHSKLCINMNHVQELMRDRHYKIPDCNDQVLPPILFTKNATARSCSVPRCLACGLSSQKLRSTNVKTSRAIAAKDGILKFNQYEPGDKVFTDQFVVHTPGRRLDGYGRDGPERSLHGGTLYTDAASNFVYVECQTSMGAGETVMGKTRFEQMCWNLAGVTIKNFHSDNGVYDASVFRDDCISKDQSQTFSGVGAKHQNAVAERNIQTICYWARHMMVHAAVHWPSNGSDNIRLWPFAVQHAVWLFNRIPNRVTGLTPLEVFTKTKSDHRDLQRAHVWGCPVFVLDPRLQDGKKIPKWNRRARLAQFVGFSPEHSTLVANVRHLQTNHVSPQFHLIHDDNFETILNDTPLDHPLSDERLLDLFASSREVYADIERSEDGAIVYTPPPLDDIWLDEGERREKRLEVAKERARTRDRWKFEADQAPVPIPSLQTTDIPRPTPQSPSGPVISDDESSCSSESSDDDSVDSTVAANPYPVEAGRRRQRSRPNEGASLGGPRRSKRLRRGRNQRPLYPLTGLALDSSHLPKIPRTHALVAQFSCTLGAKQPSPLAISNNSNAPKRKLQALYLAKVTAQDRLLFANLDWSVPNTPTLLASPLDRYLCILADKCGTGNIEDLHVQMLSPLILAAKTAASKEDNPTWWQAMNGPYAEEYWKAAQLEIETLEKIKAWTVVPRTDDITNVLPSTWAFKVKRYPDGTVKKFKGRFCARGDKQIQGVDFFETYSPVVQWTTIRLMLVLECILGLCSKQGDITCAFLHASLGKDEAVYIEMPQGFKQYDKNGKPKVLKLNRTLYGLRQSPRAFWLYLTEKLERCGLKQSQLDPCLFIGSRVICIVYVDDLLFWSPKEEYIYEFGECLRAEEVELEEEGDAAGFLGVQLHRDETTGHIHMTQEGLIKRIIEALGLDMDQTNAKGTPAERKPLVKDENGEPPQETFNYASVVGMLLYLSGHTRPDLAYSVSQVARFMFNPKHSHEIAIKRIGRYLIGTKEKGMIIKPTATIGIDAYPDADFAGLYGYEDNNDPVCVRSRTGYVITVAGCPIFWSSKLQTETATSTMEAEIIALGSCCRELLPIIALVDEIGVAVGYKKPDDDDHSSSSMHVTIHEDNSGALILATTPPPQFTPRSKHYAIKTIWFREKIIEKKIKVVPIETRLQLGDIFTKMPPQVTFEFLRNLLQGW
jgi:hypothetical protein